MYARPHTEERIAAMSMPSLLGYYRFNTLGSYPGAGADSAGNQLTAKDTNVDIVAVAVPWEPASLHSIDGVDSVAGAAPLKDAPWLSSKATAGRTLSMTGRGGY